jgi:DNA-binding CsgD family transcriptional regulator
MRCQNLKLEDLMSQFPKFKHIILYGSLMAGLIFVLKWLQWEFLIVDNSLDIYIGLIALLFTLLGVWVATQLVKPKVQEVIVEREVFVTESTPFEINTDALARLNFTNREFEIMQLLARGHSNPDIADRLFLSVSTVKTHVSNLFSKLDVKNRIQAIEKAKRLRIIE